MKGIVNIDVPDWQIGQEVSIYFKDTMMVHAKVENNEPVEAEIEGGGSTWWYVCGECRGAIDRHDKFCKHCGRKIGRRKIDG